VSGPAAVLRIADVVDHGQPPGLAEVQGRPLMFGAALVVVANLSFRPA